MAKQAIAVFTLASTKPFNQNSLKDYLFRSERLGFRAWKEEDLILLNRLNSIREVMRYFPNIPDQEQNSGLLQRMMTQYHQRGYCYFPVEELESEQFVGFIGLAYQDYPASFTPGVDIGWRLLPEFWGKGLATEGAIKALEFGFREMGLERIFSIASAINSPSIAVMQKIGMNFLCDFTHPKLQDHPDLASCAVYELTKTDYLGKR